MFNLSESHVTGYLPDLSSLFSFCELNVSFLAAELISNLLSFQSVSNYLILSLAVADLMVATLVMPIAALNEISNKWWLGKWPSDFSRKAGRKGDKARKIQEVKEEEIEK